VSLGNLEVEHTSVRFTVTSALQGLSAIGTIGDAYDTQSVIVPVDVGSPFRATPLRTLSDLETPTMDHVQCGGTERLHSQLSNVTAEGCEQADYASRTGSPSGDAANKRRHDFRDGSYGH
jgi:hypothetical protein